ncbi:hypothetical protein OSB04_un000494, partial [Centaurea solstitialis]
MESAVEVSDRPIDDSGMLEVPLVDSTQGLEVQAARKSVFTRLTPNLQFSEKEKKKFADIVGNTSKTPLCFFPPESKGLVELANKAAKTYHTTLFGYFLGPRLPFLLVKEVIKRMWSKFGFSDLMMNANGGYFLRFNDEGGCTQAIEDGPLFIRGAPFFVSKWDPAKGLTKPVHD